LAEHAPSADSPRDPIVLLALCLALAALASAFVQGRRAAGLDFYQFWVVAQVAGRADVPDVYDYETRARLGAEFVRRAATDEDSPRRRAVAGAWPVLEPTATPFFYAALRPLAGGAYERAHLLFSLLSLAALAAGLLATARLLGHGPAPALLALAFVGLAFQPLQSDIRVGNVNQLQLGLAGAFLWLSARDDRSPLQVAAGALLALLVLFKPNLLPVLPLLAAGWLWRGRQAKLARQGAGLAAGALLALLATLLVYGSVSVWAQWVEYLNGLPPAKLPLSYGNVGLGRLLFEAVGEDLSPLLAALGTGVALFCLWRGRGRAREDGGRPALEDGTALAAGVLVYLLSAPIVWTHYLLLALPAVLVALRPDGMRAPWRTAAAAAALLGLAIDPWAEPFGVRDLQVQAVVAVLALLLLFALVGLEMAGRRALPERAAPATMPAGGDP
jgi:hypothetical protein